MFTSLNDHDQIKSLLEKHTMDCLTHETTTKSVKTLLVYYRLVKVYQETLWGLTGTVVLLRVNKHADEVFDQGLSVGTTL